MSDQLDLLLPPAARHTDPATSHAAAASYAPHQATDCGMVLVAVQTWPGRTYRQIHALLEGTIPEAVGVIRRLADLEKAGAVRKGAPIPGPNGRLASTWWPV